MKRLWGFVILMVLVACGCGGSATGTVSGKVTVKGKPLPAGIVILVAENKKSFSTGITDGNYSVANVPVGKATIGLMETFPTKSVDPATLSKTPETPPTLDAKIQPPPPSVVPKKFESPDTSGLSLNVSKGVNEFNIDVK